MNPSQLLEILRVAGRLKTNTRHCWTEPDRKESVADHSWRIALMVLLLDGADGFQEIDMNRVIRMCLIHDLGEAFTGDIPTFLKTQADADKEDQIFQSWVEGFPEPQREEWFSLLDEMNRQETQEAKVYKALDKMEALISHNESELSTWLPNEYDLQFTYGVKEAEAVPYLKELHEAIDEWTRRKISAGE